MPKRRQKPFTFSDGSQIIAWQASFDEAMEREEIEEAARAEKAKANGSGDPALFYFQEMIYAGLAAASTGAVPTSEQAFRLSAEDLDGWWDAVRNANPGWYGPGELWQKDSQLSDGSTITVLSKRPSVLMRRFRLEQEVDQQPPLASMRREAFRVMYYPKLAGCSIGTVPSMDEARAEWPAEDLQAWYDTAREVIPEWFLHLEELVEQNRQAAEEAEKKRKSRPRK
jgi:hypothetical protein